MIKGKKIIVGVLIASMVFGMMGCNNSKGNKEKPEKSAEVISTEILENKELETKDSEIKENSKIKTKETKASKETKEPEILESKGTLNICLIGSDDKFIKYVIKEFKNENENININLSNVKEFKDIGELTSKLKGEEAIDIICEEGRLRSQKVGFHKNRLEKISGGKSEEPKYLMEECEKQNLLADMTEYVKDFRKNGKLVEGIFDSYDNDGKIYRIPAIVTPLFLTIDKKDIDSVKTMKGLVELSKESKAPLWGNGYYEHKTLLYELYTHYGHDIYLEDGKISEKKLTKFLEQFKELAKQTKTVKEKKKYIKHCIEIY